MAAFERQQFVQCLCTEIDGVASLEECGVKCDGWRQVQTCDEGEFCRDQDEDAGCFPWVCIPGRDRCEGHLRLTCNEDGSGIAVVVSPTSERLQQLTPFPAWDGEDLAYLPVLVKAQGKCTTDHISPAGAITPDSPAGQFLQDNGVEPKDFNSFGSRRGNDRIMTRGTFGNVRIKNQMVPGTEGGVTKYKGETTSIYEAAMAHRETGTPLVVLAVTEYGTGSSRDWAAKGTLLLGVRAVISTSFERIHRSNLIGMGVLPATFRQGTTRTSLDLDGGELTVVLWPAVRATGGASGAASAYSGVAI